MSSRKIWFITGAGRGMGVDFAKAALAAGHAVVASGRLPAPPNAMTVISVPKEVFQNN